MTWLETTKALESLVTVEYQEGGEAVIDRKDINALEQQCMASVEKYERAVVECGCAVCLGNLALATMQLERARRKPCPSKRTEKEPRK